MRSSSRSRSLISDRWCRATPSRRSSPSSGSRSRSSRRSLPAEPRCARARGTPASCTPPKCANICRRPRRAPPSAGCSSCAWWSSCRSTRRRDPSRPRRVKDRPSPMQLRAMFSPSSLLMSKPEKWWAAVLRTSARCLISSSGLAARRRRRTPGFWTLHARAQSGRKTSTLSTSRAGGMDTWWPFSTQCTIDLAQRTEWTQNQVCGLIKFTEPSWRRKTGSFVTQVVPGEPSLTPQSGTKWWKTQVEETSDGLEWWRNFIMEWNGSFRFTWKCFTWSVASQVDLLYV